MAKEIICGEIHETIMDTPINVFKKALELSKEEDFSIETNNPQFVEALEVLCGEENIDYYFFLNGEFIKEESVKQVYDYLGEVYNIINTIRFCDDIDCPADEESILEEIKEYEMKHDYLSEKGHPVEMDQFKDYEEIVKPRKIQAYQTNKTVVFVDDLGNRRVANKGDWIVKYSDGSFGAMGDIFPHKYKRVEND